MLVSFDQARLGGHPRLICRIVRSYQLLDQRLSLGMVCIVFNNKQCGFHYTASASTLSYSSWNPEKSDHHDAVLVPSFVRMALSLNTDLPLRKARGPLSGAT